MTTFKEKKINVILVVVYMAVVIILLYPIGSKLLKMGRSHLYVYGYSWPANLTMEDVSKLPPAEAVPILMYHGVRGEGLLGDNTERQVFISQMEMLKQKGYETISIKEYDLFREGKFTLPAKPIILTFDDGRKDSFYTVDEILKKLGFKATIFIATTKANIQEEFFLNWDELKEVQATGRWEIEAHGQRSHDEVLIDENGTLGNFLVSRMYISRKGLESVEEYKKRVEADYVNGISDLKEHLGVEAHYFAVPLNDYGDYDSANYEDAYKFNQELTRQFFRLAFVQAEQQDGIALESFYNYQDSAPYISLKRLEVKNINSEDLLKLLEYFSPKSATLIFPNAEGVESFLQNTRLLYGKIETSRGLTLMSSTKASSARMLFGDKGWKNYKVKTMLTREKGQSVSLLVHYLDENNFVSLDWGGKSLKLIERVDGEERELVSYYPYEKEGPVEILLRVYNNFVSAYFDGILLTRGVSIKLSRGAVGFGVWDSDIVAQSTIKKLEIVNLGK